MKKNYIVICVFLSALVSCNKSIERSTLELFSDEINLTELEYEIDNEELALVEGIQWYESYLVVLDYYSGKSFTLFDLNEGTSLGRFGTIGQGPSEIPLGCYGHLNNENFDVVDTHIGLIARYNIDSLAQNINSNLEVLARYKIPEGQFSRIIPANDSIFIGAGVYNSKFQFALFNSQSQVIDSCTYIYNVLDDKSNMYHKFLVNQGVLKRHPTLNRFVYAINYSSNIDFIMVTEDNSSIQSLKSIRMGDPKYRLEESGGMNMAFPEDDNTIGYIDIAADNNYVYALYSADKIIDNKGEGNPLESNTILVYDWDGNPIRKYNLNKAARYITVDSKEMKLYTAIISDKHDDGFSIASYNLKHD